MARFIYSKEQIDFVKKISPGKYNDEIATLFNEKFGTTVSESAMKGLKNNNKIRSGVSRAKPGSQKKLFTAEQHQFIVDNLKGASNSHLVDRLNNKFGLEITQQQLKAYKANHGLTSGLTGHFEKGHVPINKGTKGMFNAGGNKTSFKKGQTPINHKPVGSERVDTDGYTLVKISEPNVWRPKHKILWEETNGEMPKNHALLFADGDKGNIHLDNLILISRRQLVHLNRNGWISDNPEATKTGLLLADIRIKTADLMKDKTKGG